MDQTYGESLVWFSALGARLEQLNKKLATRILISQTTMDRISGHYRIRPMGTVALRGKSRRVAIYCVDGYKDADEPQSVVEGRTSPDALAEQSPRGDQPRQ